MRFIILTTIILSALYGCSSNYPTTPLDGEPINLPRFIGSTSNQWVWGNYRIAISPDHNAAEILPQRAASYHLNITPFVEEAPCSNCLWIGKVTALPDGTIALKINLRHPFYGHPKYTGFDVRGICVFKATDNLVDKCFAIQVVGGSFIVSCNIPLYCSYPLNGGAALLNADGYTFTLNPLINMHGKIPLFNMPIFDYSKAKHAYGDVDTTVNPYKLFADKSPRRTFKHNDLFTRTYHIKPPEGSGPFEFGYVVSACWAPPIKTPVSNPETDFPITANCEDAYEISIVQLTPCTQEKYNTYEPIFKAIIKHRKDQDNMPGSAAIISSTFFKSNQPPVTAANLRCFLCSYFGPGHPSYHPDDVKEIDDETTELIFRANEDHVYDPLYSIVPGWHLGILTFMGQKQEPIPGAQFLFPYSVHPVMMYVQE